MALASSLMLALLAAALSAVLTGLSIPLARLAGAVDRPGHIKIHAVETPRLGGAGFIAAVAAVGAGLGVMSGVALAGLAAMGAVGFLDDRYSISPRAKLAGQCVAGALLALHFIRAGAPWWVSGGAFLLTLGLANAINLLDGMNGLAAGCTLIAAVAIAAMSASSGAALAVAASTAGALTGFLPWNYPRARTFMGDIGSLGLGYLLALAISEAGSAGPGAWMLAAGTLSIPVFDVGLGMVRRWRRGVPISSGDRDHFYDQIHRRTGNLLQTTGLVWGASALVCLVCVVSARVVPAAGWLVCLLLVAAYAAAAHSLGFIDPDGNRRGDHGLHHE